MTDITWTGHGSSEVGGLCAVTVPSWNGWIWVIYRDLLPVRDSLTHTGDEWETEAEAKAAAERELERLEMVKQRGM